MHSLSFNIYCKHYRTTNCVYWVLEAEEEAVKPVLGFTVHQHNNNCMWVLWLHQHLNIVICILNKYGLLV